jgi:hypothetical protein
MRTAPKHKGKGVYINTHPAHQIIMEPHLLAYTHTALADV